MSRELISLQQGRELPDEFTISVTKRDLESMPNASQAFRAIELVRVKLRERGYIVAEGYISDRDTWEMDCRRICL